MIPSLWERVPMFRFLPAIAVCALATPSLADDTQKEAECQFQADLIAAVQQARLDRVDKDELPATLLKANPDWPASVETAIPAVAEYVYGFKRRDLKKVDLGAATKEQCLENWEQIQSLKNTVSN